MPSPLIMLPGKVNASGALLITMGAAITDSGGGSTGGVGPIAQLQGKVDANGYLVVKII